MADTKISALTAATAPILADEFVINEAGTSKKLTLQQTLDGIGLLAAPSIIADADEIAVTQSGIAKGATITQIKAAIGALRNGSTANQTGFAADTYLAGSSITIPAGFLSLANTQYYCAFDMVKTAAGTAAATVIIRFGTAGAIGDTARVTFTWGAGTAAIDTGVFEVWAHFRNVGAAAVLVAMCRVTHHLAATGLVSTGASGVGILPVASGTFDSTVANSIIGLSFNGGASFAGTNLLVESRLRL